MQSDRTIPEPIKRQARQRCGFGCVVCGLPIYEYDHITEWSQVHEHDAGNLVLLCPLHHAEKTKGLLTANQVRAANLAPHNIAAGITTPYGFHYQGHDQKIVMGGNVFNNDVPDADTAVVPLLIDGIGIIGLIIERGKVFLNLNLFDGDDRLILQIEENELKFMPDTWDITFVKTKLTVREAARKILLEINFKAPDTVVINRAELRCRGVRVRIRDNMLAILNNKSIIRNVTFSNFPVALNVGNNPDPELSGAIDLPNIERLDIDWQEREAWFRHETLWF